LLIGFRGNLKIKPHDDTRKSEVVVYHSAYGLRPAIIDFGDKLRAAGHLVHTPDLYDGEVFRDRNDAIRKIQELGFDRLLERAVSAIASLPRDLVYAGVSNGRANLISMICFRTPFSAEALLRNSFTM